MQPNSALKPEEHKQAQVKRLRALRLRLERVKRALARQRKAL